MSNLFAHKSPAAVRSLLYYVGMRAAAAPSPVTDWPISGATLPGGASSSSSRCPVVTTSIPEYKLTVAGRSLTHFVLTRSYSPHRRGSDTAVLRNSPRRFQASFCLTVITVITSRNRNTRPLRSVAPRKVQVAETQQIHQQWSYRDLGTLYPSSVEFAQNQWGNLGNSGEEIIIHIMTDGIVQCVCRDTVQISMLF